MALYDILRNRTAVWLLKVLHDNEVYRKSYSLSAEDLAFRAMLNGLDQTDLMLLEGHGLIGVERHDGRASYTITHKGIKFVQTLDSLKNVLDNSHVAQEKKVNVKYDLHDMEKKILLVLHQLSKGKHGHSVELTDVSKKLYKSKRVPPNVAKHADNLSKLNLIDKRKKGEKMSVALTMTGMRVLNENVGQSVRF